MFSDNGFGMPKEVSKRIFDPFFTTKPDGRGTGLGLAIVQRIVADADGSVDVSTEVGRGTTFVIRLPLSVERVAGLLSNRSNDLPDAVFPARILLLDDSDLLRCAVRTVLEKAGYEVIEGENGREGLARLLEKTPIDLVLSDWMMFDMDGEALLAEMREQKILTPALLMTGRADPEIDTIAETYRASRFARLS